MTGPLELIDELCPDGVEYKKLGDVSKIYDGTHQTPKYTDNGIKFVSVENIEDLYASKKYISVKDYEKYKIKPQINDVLMTRIGSIGICAVIEKDEPLAYYVSLALIRPDIKVVESKYLKYAIESLNGRKELYKRTLVNAVPIKINMGDIGKIVIPVPPLEIQREIVRILDKFTELTAREQQYEYYRNKLFSDDDANWVTLEEISINHDSERKPVKKGNRVSGNYPYYGASGIVDYVSEYIFDGDYLLVSEDGANLLARTTPIAFSISGKNWVNNHAHILEFKNYDLRRYVEFYLNSIDLSSYISSGAQPKLNQANLNKIRIPLYTDAKIHHVVDVLDRFDAICHDLTAGLPAEIEAREQQYEYYRDKLLTFKRKEA